MPSRLVVVLVVSLVVFPFKLRGQSADTNPQQQEKVARVNFQDAISATQQYQKIKEDLIRKSAPKNKDIAKQNAELETLRRRLSNQENKLSDNERNSLVVAIAIKANALQVAEAQSRDEFQKDATKALNKLARKAWPVVQNYAEANGYAVILDTSASPNLILYASEATVSKYGLKGKPPAEIENALLSVFSGKDAQPIDHELTATLDAAIR
jgi:Skp family chaperone for outer membrane proteins